jgi:hypothetical protein
MLASIIPFVLIVGPIFVPTIVEETVPNTADHNSGIASSAAKVNRACWTDRQGDREA